MKKHFNKIEDFYAFSQKQKTSTEERQDLRDISLDLRKCQIKIEDVQILGQGIENCSNLTSLNINLEGKIIKEEGALALGESISKCTNLTSLQLDFGYFVKHIFFVILIKMVKERCQSIGPQGFKGLLSHISKCINLTSLALNVSFNGIKSEEIKLFGELIVNFKNLTSLYLDVEGCDIESNGLILLGQSIGKCKGLNSLKLNLNNNSISDDGIIEFGSEIGQCEHLTSLDLLLCDNTIDVDCIDGYQSICTEAILGLSKGMAKCKKMTYLNIDLKNSSSMGIFGYVDGSAFAKLVENFENLTTLKLKFTIGPTLWKLDQGINNWTNLTSLDLYLGYNQFEPQCFLDLGKAIKNMTKLIFLKLDFSMNYRSIFIKSDIKGVHLKKGEIKRFKGKCNTLKNLVENRIEYEEISK